MAEQSFWLSNLLTPAIVHECNVVWSVYEVEASDVHTDFFMLVVHEDEIRRACTRRCRLLKIHHALRIKQRVMLFNGLRQSIQVFSIRS
jgi:hypothetical protein